MEYYKGFIMKNIIILGNGQLGSFIYKNWKLKDYNINIINYPTFDITNQEMIKTIVSNYDIIINAAAYTLVDKAQTDQLNCFNINSVGPMMLASECIKNNKLLIHISTESIYGSNDVNYIPILQSDQKNPINIYAKSKYLADYFIQNINNQNILILRSGWLFGPNNDHNFIEKIKNVILQNDKIKVVTDQIGSLTYVGLILQAIELFLTNKLPADTYNIANNQFASRYEVACFVRDFLNANCIIEKCSSNEFKRAAEVAKNSCLDCNKIKKYFNIKTNWKQDVLKVLNFKNTI